MGGNIQGMDIGSHHVAQRLVDELMTLQRTQIRKACRHDAHAKVPETTARTGMARVQMAIVDQVNCVRVELLAKQSTDALHTSTGLCRLP